MAMKTLRGVKRSWQGIFLYSNQSTALKKMHSDVNPLKVGGTQWDYCLCWKALEFERVKYMRCYVYRLNNFHPFKTINNRML